MAGKAGRSGRREIHPAERLRTKHKTYAEPLTQQVISASPNAQKHQDTVMGYVDDVISGRNICGQMEIAACDRFLEDLESDRGFRMDWGLAGRVMDWFASLRHTQGDWYGQPFDLYPIQAFIVANVFGFVWETHEEPKKIGLRRFQTAWITMGRGGGKTPLSAGMILRVSGFDEPQYRRMPSYFTAVTRKQARLAFEDVGAFSQSSGLQDKLVVMKDIIKIPETDNTMEPLPAQGGATSGLRIYGLMRDEIHAWTKFQRNFYDELRTGLGKFDQPLEVVATTAGNENSCIWEEELKHATQVVTRGNGYEDDTLFAMICQYDDTDDILDPKNLDKSNPLLKHGIPKKSFLVQLIENAKHCPFKRQQFQRFHANRLTESISKPITKELWDSCGHKELPDIEGIEAFAGFDLGQNRDLTAFGWVFELPFDEEIGRQFVIDCDVFIPSNSRIPYTKEPFKGWIEQGYLTLTKKTGTDFGALYKRLEYRENDHGVQCLAYDPKGATEFASNIEEQHDLPIFGFAQNKQQYTEPLSSFLEALDAGRIYHDNNPVLGWAARNMATESDSSGSYMMPSKEKSDDKIDPIIAVLMAYGTALLQDPPQPLDYYEHNEVELV